MLIMDGCECYDFFLFYFIRHVERALSCFFFSTFQIQMFIVAFQMYRY